ncbi:MAG: hypothetical protein WD607_08625 [Candidatus Paceibacterota bacterium]
MDKNQPDNHNNTLEWQRKAFPYMAGVIVFFSLFFLIATGYQLIHIQNKIDFSGKNIGGINENDAKNISDTPKSELTSKIELETYVIDRRYHQSNMLLISRIWIQYLGFLVGTILVLIGAIFILGKMQEQASSFDSDIKSFGKVAFNSSSPGLFLALFGTLIISTTLFYHPEITTEDASLYLDKRFEFDVGNTFPSVRDSIDKTLTNEIDMSRIDSTEIEDLDLDL